MSANQTSTGMQEAQTPSVPRSNPRPARNHRLSKDYTKDFIVQRSSEDSLDEDPDWERRRKKSLKRSSKKASNKDSGERETAKKRTRRSSPKTPISESDPLVSSAPMKAIYNPAALSAPIALNDNNGGSKELATVEEGRNGDSGFPNQPLDSSLIDSSKPTLDAIVKPEPDEDEYSVPPLDEVCPLSDPEYEPYDSPSENDDTGSKDPEERKLNAQAVQNRNSKEESAITGPDPPFIAKILDPDESDQKLLKIKNDPVDRLATASWKHNSPFYIPESMNIALRVSETCRIGSNFDENRIRNLPPYESRPYPTQYTLVVQDLMESARHLDEFIDVIKVAGSGEPSFPFPYPVNGKLEFKNIPIVESVNSAQAWLSDLLESVGCCKKLFLPDFIASEFVCKPCLVWNERKRNDAGVTRENVASDSNAEATQVTEMEEERRMNVAEGNTREEEQRNAEEKKISANFFPLEHSLPSSQGNPTTDLVKPDPEDSADIYSLPPLSEVCAIEDMDCSQYNHTSLSPSESSGDDSEEIEVTSRPDLTEKQKHGDEEKNLEQSARESAQRNQKDEGKKRNAGKERKADEQREAGEREESKKLESLKKGEDTRREEEEFYNNLNSFFLHFFKRPAFSRSENPLFFSSPGVSKLRYIRSIIHMDCLKVTWKLGDEEAMDSSLLKKDATHSCSGDRSPLKVDGTMLEMWESLLRLCPRCILPSSWPMALEKVKRFMADEEKKWMEDRRVEQEKQQREEREQVNDGMNKQIEEVERERTMEEQRKAKILEFEDEEKKKDEKMIQVLAGQKPNGHEEYALYFYVVPVRLVLCESTFEGYNRLNSVFFMLFRIPEERNELRPNIRNIFVTKFRRGSFYNFVRVNVYFEGEKEMWKLGDEEAMDSSVLRNIRVHNCSKMLSPLDTGGTMLELWRNLLLRCPKCIAANCLTKAMGRIKCFMEEEDGERRLRLKESKLKEDEERKRKEERTKQAAEEKARKEMENEKQQREERKQVNDGMNKQIEKVERERTVEEQRKAKILEFEEEEKKKDEEIIEVMERGWNSILSIRGKIRLERCSYKSKAERYDSINSVFLSLFRIPERRNELRPDIQNIFADEYPHRFFNDVRVKVYFEGEKEMWKLGDEEAMDSSVLRNIRVHKCSRILSSLDTGGTMLELWRNLLLRCPKCIAASCLSWTTLERIKVFLDQEESKRRSRLQEAKREKDEERKRKEKEAWKEMDNEAQRKRNAKAEELRKEKERRRQKILIKEKKQEVVIGNLSKEGRTRTALTKERYNNLNAFFLYHFKLPEGRTELRPDIGNPVITSSPGLSFKHMVRSKTFFDNQTEMWQLGIETPMDSSVLRKITTHSCPSARSTLNTGGTMLELWHSLLVHCPSCVNERCLKTALDKVREFIEAECQRS